MSGSDDKTIIVWETLRGLALTSLQLHVQFTRFDISLECSRILVHLTDNPSFPIICLHNSPAQYIKLPTYSAPARDVEGEFSSIMSIECFCTISFPDRLATSCGEAAGPKTSQEGIVTRHLLVAEEVRPFDVFGNDGTG